MVSPSPVGNSVTMRGLSRIPRVEQKFIILINAFHNICFNVDLMLGWRPFS